MNLFTELLEGVKRESSLSFFDTFGLGQPVVKGCPPSFLGHHQYFPCSPNSFFFLFYIFDLGQLIVKIPFLDIANTFTVSSFVKADGDGSSPDQ